MSSKEEVRRFLVSRRANLTPAHASLPHYGQERRVPGLRREEVAQLAGINVDYYTRLERGNIHGASDSVLHAVARALQLSDVEPSTCSPWPGALPSAPRPPVPGP